MSSPVFRKVALERMSSPDQLDQVVRVTSAQEWLSLLSLVLLIAGAVVWSFVDRLPSRTDAHAVVMRAGEPVTVVSSEAGIVTQIAVKPGDLIRAGQLIAVLSQERRQATGGAGTAGLFSLLQANTAVTQQIRANASGEVLELLAMPGSPVNAGAGILSFLPDDIKDLEVVTFVPALKAQKVKPGMAVEVDPGSVRAGEYGFMRGKVKKVATYPATDDELVVALRNSSAGAAVAAERPVYEVRVELIRDKAAPGGYQWSTKKGSGLKIDPGTPAFVHIVTSEDAPVKLVIPAIKNSVESF